LKPFSSCVLGSGDPNWAMAFDEFKNVSGVSFLQLPSGNWRVKVGKKLTGGAVVVKTGSEKFVCKLARDYVQEAERKRDNSIYISDLERGQAVEALSLLKENEVELSLLEVVRIYCDRLPKNKKITVRFACDVHLDLLEARQRDKTKKSRHIKSLNYTYRSLCHLYGDRLLFDLSAEEIQEWLEVRCLGKTANTCNHYLKAVRAIYSMAVKKKWVVENVSLEVELLPVFLPPVGVFDPDEIKSLLQAAYDEDQLEMLLFFAIQSFAGLRRSEVMGLRWRDIGASSIRVTATNAKTEKGRGVEILPPLQKILSLFSEWKKKKIGMIQSSRSKKSLGTEGVKN